MYKKISLLYWEMFALEKLCWIFLQRFIAIGEYALWMQCQACMISRYWKYCERMIAI